MGASFYVTLIGAAVIFTIFYLQSQRRTTAIQALAARLGFSPPGNTLPSSLNLRETGLAPITLTSNVMEGQRRGIKVIAFDCQIGRGKGSWYRTVIAAQTSDDIFGMFNPEFTVEHSGDWVILYQSKGVSAISSGFMSADEIEARLNALA